MEPKKHKLNVHITKYVKDRRLDMLKLLLGDLKSEINNINENGFSLLHISLLKQEQPRSVDVLKFLLSIPNINSNIKDANGRTALAAAIFHSDESDLQDDSLPECVQLLIEYEPRELTDFHVPIINIVDDLNNTPLHLAVGGGHLKFASLLVKLLQKQYESFKRQARKQYDGNLCSLNWEGHTALHLAVKLENLEMVNLLSEYIDSEVRNVENETPLKYAIDLNVDIKIQEALINYVKDFTKYEHDEDDDDCYACCTLLSAAIAAESPICDELVRRGATVNFGGAYGDVVAYSREKGDVKLTLCMIKTYKQTGFEYSLLTSPLEYGYLEKDMVEPFITAIATSEHIKEVVESCESCGDFRVFIWVMCYKFKLTLALLTQITLAMCENGYSPTENDLDMVYFFYGFCDLYKRMLLMDFSSSESWFGHNYCTAKDCLIDGLTRQIYLDVGMSHLICSVGKIETVLDEFYHMLREPSWDGRLELYVLVCDSKRLQANAIISILEELLNYTVYPPLVVLYNELLENNGCHYKSKKSRMPSLLDLARNQARNYIMDYYKIEKCKQFYTLLNESDLFNDYKKLLSFERKIYC